MRGVVGILIVVILSAVYGAGARLPLLVRASQPMGDVEDAPIDLPAGPAGEAFAGELIGPGMECFLCGVEDLREQIAVVGVGLRDEPPLDLTLFDPAGAAGWPP